MRPRRAMFVVSFDLPRGVGVRHAKAYVEEAVASWHGSLQPPGVDLGDGTVADGDPMFLLNPDSVKVRNFYKKETRT